MENLNRLAALWGKGTKRKPTAGGVERASPVEGSDDYDAPLPRTLSREERQREQLIKAKERERKQFQRYRDARQYRLLRLQDAHPEVRRYLNALGRIEGEAKSERKNDCDFDLAELASRCGISALPSDSDRFLIYELTTEWLQRIGGKRFHLQVAEDEDFFADPFENTAMGELRRVLGVR